MAIGPNVIDDCEGMTEEEYYRGMDEVMKRQIETTDVDVEATAWAIATLEALHVDCMSTENAAMMERLREMTGAERLNSQAGGFIARPVE